MFVGSLLFFVARYAWGFDARRRPAATRAGRSSSTSSSSRSSRCIIRIFARTRREALGHAHRAAGARAIASTSGSRACSSSSSARCGSRCPGVCGTSRRRGRADALGCRSAACVHPCVAARGSTCCELAGIRAGARRWPRRRAPPSARHDGPVRPRPPSDLSRLAAHRLAGADDDRHTAASSRPSARSICCRGAVRGATLRAVRGRRTTLRGEVRGGSCRSCTDAVRDPASSRSRRIVPDRCTDGSFTRAECGSPRARVPAPCDYDQWLTRTDRSRGADVRDASSPNSAPVVDASSASVPPPTSDDPVAPVDGTPSEHLG